MNHSRKNDALALDLLKGLSFSFVRTVLSLQPIRDFTYREQLKQGQDPFTILRYRRIVTPHSLIHLPDFYVKPAVLELHAGEANSKLNPISVQSLTERLLGDEPVPPKSICITFDGGFREQFESAKKLVDVFKLPITIFLATDFIDSRNLFWQEKLLLALDKIQRETEVGPLDVDIGVDPEDEAYGVAKILYILEQAEQSSWEDRSLFLQRTLSKADSLGGLQYERNFMTWDEVKELAEHPLITIGVHGASGQAWEELRSQELTADIKRAQQALSAREVPWSPLVAPPPFSRFVPREEFSLPSDWLLLNYLDGPADQRMLRRLTLTDSTSNTKNLFLLRVLQLI